LFYNVRHSPRVHISRNISRNIREIMHDVNRRCALVNKHTLSLTNIHTSRHIHQEDTFLETFFACSTLFSKYFSKQFSDTLHVFSQTQYIFPASRLSLSSFYTVHLPFRAAAVVFRGDLRSNISKIK